MKKYRITLYSIIIIFSIISFIKCFNYEDPIESIRCLVIEKKDIIENNKQKNVIYNNPVYYLIVYSKYGYGRIPVTTNTFYTTKLNHIIFFGLKPKEINNYFNQNKKVHKEDYINYCFLLSFLCITTFSFLLHEILPS